MTIMVKPLTGGHYRKKKKKKKKKKNKKKKKKKKKKKNVRCGECGCTGIRERAVHLTRAVQ